MRCVVCVAAVANTTAAERELFRFTQVCSFACVGRLKLVAAVVNYCGEGTGDDRKLVISLLEGDDK